MVMVSMLFEIQDSSEYDLLIYSLFFVHYDMKIE